LVAFVGQVSRCQGESSFDPLKKLLTIRHKQTPSQFLHEKRGQHVVHCLFILQAVKGVLQLHPWVIRVKVWKRLHMNWLPSVRAKLSEVSLHSTSIACKKFCRTIRLVSWSPRCTASMAFLTISLTIFLCVRKDHRLLFRPHEVERCGTCHTQDVNTLSPFGRV